MALLAAVAHQVGVNRKLALECLFALVQLRRLRCQRLRLHLLSRLCQQMQSQLRHDDRDGGGDDDGGYGLYRLARCRPAPVPDRRLLLFGRRLCRLRCLLRLPRDVRCCAGAEAAIDAEQRYSRCSGHRCFQRLRVLPLLLYPAVAPNLSVYCRDVRGCDDCGWNVETCFRRLQVLQQQPRDADAVSRLSWRRCVHRRAYAGRCGGHGRGRCCCVDPCCATCCVRVTRCGTCVLVLVRPLAVRAQSPLSAN